MNLIDRVKGILTAPQKEWQTINSEQGNPQTITTTYLIPLVLIGTVAAFVGYGLIGINVGFGYRFKSAGFGIKMAIGYAIGTLVGIFILAFIIDMLAPNFGAEKNFNKSFQVAAYTYTASLVAAVFFLLPSLAIIAALAGIYGLYLLYIGLPILKPSKEADKKTTYFIVVLVVAIVVNILVGYIQREIFYPSASDFVGF